MIKMRRSEKNPILIPIADNTWEADGAFNGCPSEMAVIFTLFTGRFLHLK